MNTIRQPFLQPAYCTVATFLWDKIFADSAQRTFRKLNFAVHEACAHLSLHAGNFVNVNFTLKSVKTDNNGS